MSMEEALRAQRVKREEALADLLAAFARYESAERYAQRRDHDALSRRVLAFAQRRLEQVEEIAAEAWEGSL